MRIWRESLLARLLGYFLLLAIIPLAVVGAIAYGQGQRTLQKDILDHLTTTATLKEDEINRWVESTKQDVQLLAVNPALRDQAEVLLTHNPESDEFVSAYQAIQSYLENVLAEKPDFLEILILRGVGGEILLSTTSAHEGNYEVTSSFFTEGRKGTFVQNVYPSVALGKPAMTVSTPLRDAGGETLGVLAVHLNLAKLDDIMLERGGLGETGETYLVDKFNVFISEARFGGESFPRGVHTEGIDAALLNQEDGAGIYDNYRGVPVIGAYRWLDEREMALLAEIEVKEALAPVRRLALVILLVGTLVTALVVAAAYGVSRQLSRPILALTESSAQIADGDLSQTVDIHRDDEIGILARSFNSMAAQLRDLVGELEQRVVERTRALERRAAQLETASQVARDAATTLDPEVLLRRTVELIRERFGFYHASIFLLDEKQEYAVLHAATGEAGRQMLAQGFKLEVGQVGMVGYVAARGRPRIALDVGEDAVYFDNPLLPDTRSEMTLPLQVRGQILGVLDVQSTEAGAFTDEDVAVLQTLADQVAIALDNARLYQEAQQSLSALETLYQEYSQATWAQEASALPGFRYDQVQITPVGEVWTSAMEEAVRQGRVVVDQDGRGKPAPGAILAAPLMVRDQTIGALQLHKDEPGATWTEDEVLLVEATAVHIGLALEIARLFQDTQRRAAHERVVRRVTERMRRAVDVETILRTTVIELAKALDAPRVYVRLGAETDLLSVEGEGADQKPQHPALEGSKTDA